jgi:two-component system sensor histidine kinase FlrB
MSLGIPHRRNELQDAFQVFNNVSEQLVNSYQHLQERVEALNSELAENRQDRTRQLAEKERLVDRLAQVLDALPAAVVVLDGEDRVLQYNSAAREFFSSIEAGAAWNVLSQNTLENGRKENEQVLNSGRLVSVTECPLASEPGRILLLVDVTEVRGMQERLNRRERLSAMGEMAARLAHQIRTPLSSALLYISHLSSDKLSSQKRTHFAERARTRLLLMERQINDMLSFARGCNNTSEPVAISDLLPELAQMLTPQLKAGNAKLKCKDLTDGACEVGGNRDALLGAVMNLAGNAIQHGPEGVSLQITLREHNRNWIELQVCDDGCGIPEDIRERVFDPFFTTSSEGTGLGLAVAQSVILGHNGQIRLMSSSGKGTCFQIRLPRIASQQQYDMSEAETAARPTIQMRSCA